jgi:hypothetical protein
LFAAAPLCGTQRLVVSQTFPLVQSSIDVHLMWHTPDPHLYGSQTVGAPLESTAVWSSWQLDPVGAHLLSAPQVKPLTQSLSSAQLDLHFPLPSQTNPLRQIFGDSATHAPLPSQVLSVSSSLSQLVPQPTLAPG